MKRVLLLTVSAFTAFFVGAALAQVPPLGSGVDGWLQVLYNQLADGGAAGTRTLLTESATGTTAGATATFPAVAARTNYLCGISVAPGSATTAITINVTTTGLTNNYTWSVGAPATAVGVTGAVLTVPINPCMPASAVNTAITVAAGALGTAGVNQDVNAWGYVR